jgi:hypothetical protein
VNLKTILSTKRNLLLISLVGLLLTAGLFYYLYFIRNQLKRTDLAEYAPASSALFIEINSLPDLLSGLTHTEAWRKLAPALGLSSQLEKLGGMAEFLASTGVGPEEAVLLSRAQYAVIVSGLDLQTAEADSKEGKEGKELELIPRIAFLIDTHANGEKVEKYLLPRVNLLAHRIYGSDLETAEEDYKGVKLKIYRAKELDRRIVAAQKNGLLLVGNQVESIESCLDVLNGSSPRLSQDPYLKQARARLGNGSSILAFVTGTSASRLLQLGSLSFSGAAGDQVKGIDREELARALSSQLINGIAYSATFDSGKVVDRYLALLKPEIVTALQSAVKPAKDKPEVAALVSRMDDFTLLKVEQPAETLEQVLAGVSAHVNVVVSFALRQMVISLSRQYGIDPEEPVGHLLGNEIALVKSSEAENPKSTLLIEVKDKIKLLPTVGRYLRRDGGQVRSEDYQGVEIVMGTGSEERSAAFLGSYLALSTHSEIKTVIDAWRSVERGSIDTARIDGVMEGGEGAVLISSRFDRRPAAELMLGLSRLLRATDGSRELLDAPRVQAAMAELPPSVSAARIITEGILMETQSPLGAFTVVSEFLADPAGELKESKR